MGRLISETTREERQKKIDQAIIFGSLDGATPSEKVLDLFRKYVDGEMEFDEIEKILIYRH